MEGEGRGWGDGTIGRVQACDCPSRLTAMEAGGRAAGTPVAKTQRPGRARSRSICCSIRTGRRAHRNRPHRFKSVESRDARPDAATAENSNDFGNNPTAAHRPQGSWERGAGRGERAHVAYSSSCTAKSVLCCGICSLGHLVHLAHIQVSMLGGKK